MDPLDELLIHLHAVDAMAAMLFASQAGFPVGDSSAPQIAPAFASEYVTLRLLERGTIAAPDPGPEVAIVDLVFRAEAAASQAVVGTTDPTTLATDPRRRFELHQL